MSDKIESDIHALVRGVATLTHPCSAPYPVHAVVLPLTRAVDLGWWGQPVVPRDVALIGVDERDGGIRVRLQAEAEQAGHLSIGLEGVDAQV